ncbi:hypothetical protein PW52_05950 [Tamlana sedimentorum]|uniref:DUF4382 domain-containing protein n=1 Tax=Neotamlana sedimentorum TaxID=1435349 RepID=A0A0D7WAP4_9FLAO|nr:hypothetical protein [Tamlana sedimentorum]KJD36149.1 hypothetical protein PW52_05950 [Tamlana sedimentorum]
MKHLKKISFVFLTILLNACSSSDDSNTSESNFILVGDSSFEMKMAVVEPSFNSVFLSLTNKTEAEINASFSGTTLNNVDYFSAKISHSDLSPGETYDLDDISSLEFIVDGDIINSEFENGFSQFYKSGSNSDLEVISGSITVIDYSVDIISLSFIFNRNDGTQITGSYTGSFLYFNVEDD